MFLFGLEIHLLKRSRKRAKLQRERDKLLYGYTPDGTLKKGFSANYNPAFERDNVFLNSPYGLGGLHNDSSFDPLGGAGSHADLRIVEQDDHWDEPLPHRTSFFLRIGIAGNRQTYTLNFY